MYFLDYYDCTSGAQSREILNEVKPMGGRNLPPTPGWNKDNVSENLGKAAALHALPLIMPLYLEQLYLVLNLVFIGLFSKECSLKKVVHFLMADPPTNQKAWLWIYFLKKKDNYLRLN